MKNVMNPNTHNLTQLHIDPRPTEPVPTIHLGKVIISNPVDSNGVSSPIMFAGNSNTIGTKFTMIKLTATLGSVNIVT